MLEWVAGERFVDDVQSLLEPFGGHFESTFPYRPLGPAKPAEARLESFLPQAWPGTEFGRILLAWWLAPHGRGNTPNWDLAASCHIGGKPGLLLVEAKAHEHELNSNGKKPPRKTRSKEPTPEAWQNHARIGSAIAEAQQFLCGVDQAFRISRDSNYQLSNRVAFAWKLASLGVPVILVYLGFVGDHGLSGSCRWFRTAADWSQCFVRHASAVLPPEIIGRRISCGTADFFIHLASREVLSLSPQLARVP